LDAVTASTTTTTTAATAAAATATTPAAVWSGKGEERSLEERLREQMRADALQPLDDDDGDVDDDFGTSLLPKIADNHSESQLPPKWIEDAAQFLRLNVSINLTLRPSAAVVSSPSLARLFFFPFPPWHWLIDVTSPRNAWTAFYSICVRNITTVSGVAHSIKVPTRCRKSVRDLRKICTTRWKNT
jgi:hypothetical protein